MPLDPLKCYTASHGVMSFMYKQILEHWHKEHVSGKGAGCLMLQTIKNIDEHLDDAIRSYPQNEQIKFAVDKVQTKVILLLLLLYFRFSFNQPIFSKLLRVRSKRTFGIDGAGCFRD